MLHLKPDQYLALDLLERRSFEDYCRAFNYDPTAREALLLAAAKTDWYRFRASLRDTVPDPSAADEIVNKYLSAATWKDYKRLQIADDVDRVAVRISSIRRSLQIDWAYLEQISVEGKIPKPDIDDPLALTVFLKEIPHVLIYESELNAFVTRNRHISDLPVVFIYEHLMAAVNLFLEVILKQVIVTSQNGNATVADDVLWSDLGRNDFFGHALRSAIDMVLLRSDSATIDSSLALSGSSPQFLITSRFIFLGAADFVRLHEYGHLLMGHLRHHPRPALELLADRFAMTVLASQYSENASDRFWIKLGAIGALVVLMISELIEQPRTTTHPPTRARIRALLRNANPESLWLRWHVRAMLAICRNTLEVSYGVSSVNSR